MTNRIKIRNSTIVTDGRVGVATKTHNNHCHTKLFRRWQRASKALRWKTTTHTHTHTSTQCEKWNGKRENARKNEIATTHTHTTYIDAFSVNCFRVELSVCVCVCADAFVYFMQDFLLLLLLFELHLNGFVYFSIRFEVFSVEMF